MCWEPLNSVFTGKLYLLHKLSQHHKVTANYVWVLLQETESLTKKPPKCEDISPATHEV
jgi:hypothetical protein